MSVVYSVNILLEMIWINFHLITYKAQLFQNQDSNSIFCFLQQPNAAKPASCLGVRDHRAHLLRTIGKPYVALVHGGLPLGVYAYLSTSGAPGDLFMSSLI